MYCETHANWNADCLAIELLAVTMPVVSLPVGLNEVNSC